MKVEVRCCCQPTKLLGWMEVRHLGDLIVSIAPALSWRHDPFDVSAPASERITLPLATYSPMAGPERWAFKAEGLDVATLSRIPGFTANPDIAP